MPTPGPILPGRVPDSFSAIRTRQNIRLAQSRLATLQQQISTGQRFFRPGEDPGAATQTVRLQSLAERKTQAQRNTEANRSFLSATDDSLADFSDILIRAQTASLAAIGNSSTPAEREQFVVELDALIQSAANSGNRSFRGRNLFGGSESTTPPFEIAPHGVVYRGDSLRVDSYTDLDLRLANNVDPTQVFGTDSAVVGTDLNPPLSVDTAITQLNRGGGVSEVDGLRVVVGGVPTDVDLSGAETVGDLKVRLEDAVPGLLVLVDPFAQNALRISHASGVEIQNVDGSRLATDLGLSGVGPAAAITGGDLDPSLDTLSPVAALFGGAGVGSLVDGLQVTVGTQTETLDFTGVTTVEDVLNVFRTSSLRLEAEISDDGRSISVASRVSGAAFSIGEAGGSLATDLGLRTLNGATRLDDLNDGLGVPTFPSAPAGVENRELTLNRRDGSVLTIDLLGAETIQDVLDTINAADPQLNATLAPIGNGIHVTDALPDPLAAGTAFVIEADAVSEALGIDGSATLPADVIEGDDVNPQRSGGLFSLLVQLRDAIGAGDNRHIERVSQAIDDEIGSFNTARGEVGNRLRVLETTESRLETESLRIQESIDNVFGADLAETITQLTSVQAAYEASLQVSATLLRTNLVSLL